MTARMNKDEVEGSAKTLGASHLKWLPKSYPQAILIEIWCLEEGR